MKKLLAPAAILFALVSISMQSASTTKTLYDFQARTIDGKDYDFSQLKGKKVLIVNTASLCGNTPQYADLEKLYEKYSPSGKFEILGFPCNQFAGQEPGSNDSIHAFCTRNYGVTFQMMEKIDVKGDNQHPLYKWLTNKSENGVEDAPVKWNFQKFMIDEQGHYVGHVAPGDKPFCDKIVDWIEGKAGN
ncbi:MAG TPA: glutathione peroxidase [Bacteroidia bacterium]|nr:glutathione peroxidase [Bacteroidia bacterium]